MTAVKVTATPASMGMLDDELTVMVLPVDEVTLCTRVLLDPAKFESPEKMAAMVSEPTSNVEVEQLAWPLVPLTAAAAQPAIVVPLSWNIMVPVNGVEPCAEEETVARKETAWLATDGLADEEMLTEVAAAPTVCETLWELTVKFESPE
jgi:hypothetical protein